MSVRVRGIYATALTALLADDPGVVQASPAIERRFPETELPVAPATAAIETSPDRQGVSVTGEPEVLGAVTDRITGVGRDAFAWRDPLARGAVFAGEVTETHGSGAVVTLAENGPELGPADRPVAGRPTEGFLPFGATADRIETGDRLLVQVRDPRPPWGTDRPVLDTTIRCQGGLVTLVRGASGANGSTMGGPALADLLPTEPRDGWGASWHEDSEDAPLDGLAAGLERANERAAALDAALAAAAAPSEAAPAPIHGGPATVWVWFGRESRFGLDDRRREVTATMPGHHRIKAGTADASAAVDFVEAVCPDAGGAGEGSGTDADGESVPFGVLSRQFGPREGDRLTVEHGKPDGRRFDLGTATVTAVEPDGTVTVEREMSPGGTYDGLGVQRRAGDVATTTLTEGRWWYPTVYRASDGTRRGTYVNVCTPVEVFPDAARYVDLHVDVVKHADGAVERLDDDELDAAEANGHVTAVLAEKARDVASAVERAL